MFGAFRNISIIRLVPLEDDLRPIPLTIIFIIGCVLEKNFYFGQFWLVWQLAALLLTNLTRDWVEKHYRVDSLLILLTSPVKKTWNQLLHFLVEQPRFNVSNKVYFFEMKAWWATWTVSQPLLNAQICQRHKHTCTFFLSAIYKLVFSGCFRRKRIRKAAKFRSSANPTLLMQHPAWQILGGGGLPEYSLFYRTEHKKIAFEFINI